MREQLQLIINTLKASHGNDYLYLQSSITVKLSPHSFPVNVWALCVSPSDDLYLMVPEKFGHEEWFIVDADDKGADKVIASVYQRVSSLFQIRRAVA